MTSSQQRRQNLRLGLILAGVALTFAMALVLKLLWLRA
jgi:hypothetical protein